MPNTGSYDGYYGYLVIPITQIATLICYYDRGGIVFSATMTRQNLQLTRDEVNGYGLLPPVITMLGKWPMISVGKAWKDAYQDMVQRDIQNGFAVDFVRL